MNNRRQFLPDRLAPKQESSVRRNFIEQSVWNGIIFGAGQIWSREQLEAGRICSGIDLEQGRICSRTNLEQDHIARASNSTTTAAATVRIISVTRLVRRLSGPLASAVRRTRGASIPRRSHGKRNYECRFKGRSPAQPPSISSTPAGQSRNQRSEVSRQMSELRQTIRSRSLTADL